MIGIAILCSLAGLLFGGSIGFILGYKEGENKTREWFEKKLALHKCTTACDHPAWWYAQRGENDVR